QKSRNIDSFDHTLIFQDPKTEAGYMIAWEDLLNGGDKDYQDMIVSMRLLRPPNAAFTWSPQNPLLNETIIFDASASTPNGGVIVSYKWNFGDGNITTVANSSITHAYSTSGNFTVTLNVTDSEGKWDTETKTVGVQRPPSQAVFAVKIEDTWTYLGNAYNFSFPAYCTTFKTEVWVVNVSELAGYEFRLDFDPAVVQVTQSEVKHVHTSDIILLQEVDNIGGVYRQAVTSNTSASYSGSAPIANLSLHIVNDPCFPSNHTGVLLLNNTKMSDPYGLAINHSQMHAYYNIFSLRPEISIEYEGKAEAITWIANGTFTVNITLANIVDMKGFYLELEWSDFLETDVQSVIVTSFLPQPYQFFSIGINDRTLCLQAAIINDNPAINGSGVLLRVTFRVKSPWQSVPPYTQVGTDYIPENYTGKVHIACGWIDVYCPEYRKMEFYNASYGVSVKNDLNYTFMPIPGDLNLDGIVDSADLDAIAALVGIDSGDPEWAVHYPYDLNGDDRIDVYDVVIVSSNYGRTDPW
ncbi:MAG TPA: PKD domain-containing protein, partial [Candidatus Bathyarchaeia archaeon]